MRSSCKQRLARSQRSPGAAQPFHAPSSLLPSFRGARAGVPRRNKNAACRATRAERTPAPKAPRERENFFFAPFSLWKIVSQQTEQQRLSVSFFGSKKSNSGVWEGGGPPVHIHWCHRWKNMGFQRERSLNTKTLAKSESANRFTIRILGFVHANFSRKIGVLRAEYR